MVLEFQSWKEYFLNLSLFWRSYRSHPPLFFHWPPPPSTLDYTLGRLLTASRLRSFSPPSPQLSQNSGGCPVWLCWVSFIPCPMHQEVTSSIPFWVHACSIPCRRHAGISQSMDDSLSWMFLYLPLSPSLYKINKNILKQQQQIA